MPNPRPDFAQFAEQIHWTAEQSRKLYAVPISHEQAFEAERHARLLEMVYEWATLEVETWDETDEGHRAARAHIRSLLEQG